MTQSELAVRVALSQSRISHLELNPGEISVDQLLAWTAALDLELTIGEKSMAIKTD